MMNSAELYNRELKGTQRAGVMNLINYMEISGFYTAPCSGAHHLAKEGGLLEHSLNVLDLARKLNRAWGEPVNDTSLVIVCLLHDLGKMGDHGKPNYVPNYLKDGALSKAKPYITNPELPYMPHEVRSQTIAERFIVLSEQEEIAILYHNGLYSDFRYEIQGKETPLYMLLHFSDMWASRVTEVEGGE